MSNFKIGDRVREISTGDIGVIKRGYNDNYMYHEERWWILWETGDFKGQELHLEEPYIEHYNSGRIDLHGSKLTINGVTYTLVKD